MVFQSLDARWGSHSVDRFSSYFNSQVVRFNSKYFSPGCAAVDALAQDWSSDNNWLCPPTHLIVAAVKHLRYHKGVGTIIIPEWPSASFWPLFAHQSISISYFCQRICCASKACRSTYCRTSTEGSVPQETFRVRWMSVI